MLANGRPVKNSGTLLIGDTSSGAINTSLGQVVLQFAAMPATGRPNTVYTPGAMTFTFYGFDDPSGTFNEMAVNNGASTAYFSFAIYHIGTPGNAMRVIHFNEA